MHGNTGDIKKTISIAILLCGNPSQSTVDKFGSYDNMFRHVFTEALATIPRHEWHPKISLYIRSFNVTLGEFPDVSQLDDGLWDAVVVTGTRMSILPKKKTDRQPTPARTKLCYGWMCCANTWCTWSRCTP